MSGTTVFFDVETGGLEERHPNIQIAAVAVRDWKEVESFEAHISFSEAACDPEALSVNGYRREDWVGAVSEPQAFLLFNRFCERNADYRLISRAGNPYTVAKLAGHNVTSFDIPRVRRALDAMRVFWKACWWYPLDTYARAIWHFHDRGESPENFQLQTLARRFGIPAQGAEHEALADVRLCVLIAKAITEAA